MDPRAYYGSVVLKRGCVAVASLSTSSPALALPLETHDRAT